MALGRAAKAANVLLGELKGGRGGEGGRGAAPQRARSARAPSSLPLPSSTPARARSRPAWLPPPRAHWHGTVHVWAPGQWAGREMAGLTRPGGAGKLMGLCCVRPRGARRERGGALSGGARPGHPRASAARPLAPQGGAGLCRLGVGDGALPRRGPDRPLTDLASHLFFSHPKKTRHPSPTRSLLLPPLLRRPRRREGGKEGRSGRQGAGREDGQRHRH